jgi:hypothetical protein
MNTMETNEQNLKDNNLWRIAKKRTDFKRSLLTYVVINSFFIALWYLGDQGHFWPIWCMLGWGVGLCFQYMNAYHQKGVFSIEKEYEKLKSETK